MSSVCPHTEAVGLVTCGPCAAGRFKSLGGSGTSDNCEWCPFGLVSSVTVLAPSCRVPLSFVSFARSVPCGGFIPHGTLYFFTGVQRFRCPCLQNGLLPFQHGGLWSRDSHAVGLHPLRKWSHCTEGGQQEVHQHYWPEEWSVAARLCDLAFGDVLPGRVILARIPRGAGADRPFLLLSHMCVGYQQHPAV